MDIAVKAAAFALQVCQECLACLVPRVFRECPARKEAWVRRETQATKEFLESKAPQVPREKRGHLDIRDPPDHRGRKVTKGTQATRELKGPQALQEHLDVTGNNAFFPI